MQWKFKSRAEQRKTYAGKKAMPRFRQTEEILKLMSKKDAIRNVGIIAHIDHGKTTMTDSLLVEAELLSPEVAGSAKVLDYLEEEQRRGITIKTANISLLHVMNGRCYLINLVDTPGHVDFTGKVTRALRAIDGAVVVVDAVEEVMAQTETVTRQALEERVKPVLFINKLDRLIREMKLTSAEIQIKLARIISSFNDLIENFAETEYKEEWKVDPAKESVVFGSALHKWGFTLRTAGQKGTTLDAMGITEAYRTDKHLTLSKLIPLHTAILDMIVRNLPSPVESQPYRVPRIWSGGLGSEIGQAMLNCDDEGPTVMCVTMAQHIPRTGLVATGRVFSGSIKRGDRIYLIEAGNECLVQEVSLYMGPFRQVVNGISAGNIAALSDLSHARAGHTLVDYAHKEAMTPFESVKYFVEPLMTVMIEPKNPGDLPRVREAMDRLSIEDPNLVTTIEEETGQYLISGMGELHLEIALNFMRQFVGGVDLTVSSPISAYRETVTTLGNTVMAKSQNKHNAFWVRVEPFENKVLGLAETAVISDKAKQDRTMDSLEEFENVWTVDRNKNVLVDATGDEQLLEVKDGIISGFQWACRTGALCMEPLRGVKAKLVRAQLDPHPSLRNPEQVKRAVSRAVLGSCLTAKPILLEPIYKIEVSVQNRWFGACTNIISRRRGKILSTEQKGILVIITGEIPVAETFGLSGEMRSATSGYAFWQFTFDRWSRIPVNLSGQVIKRLREKRGLPRDIPTPEMFVDEG